MKSVGFLYYSVKYMWCPQMFMHILSVYTSALQWMPFVHASFLHPASINHYVRSGLFTVTSLEWTVLMDFFFLPHSWQFSVFTYTKRQNVNWINCNFVSVFTNHQQAAKYLLRLQSAASFCHTNCLQLLCCLPLFLLLLLHLQHAQTSSALPL